MITPFSSKLPQPLLSKACSAPLAKFTQLQSNNDVLGLEHYAGIMPFAIRE
jgi:hypothetical protein